MTDEPNEPSPMVNHITNVTAKKRKLSPRLDIRVDMDMMEYPRDFKFDREMIARCKKEIAAIEGHIKNWNPEDVAKKALASLKTELAVKHARLIEHMARAKGR